MADAVRTSSAAFNADILEDYLVYLVGVDLCGLYFCKMDNLEL
ncbi:hypothetical protein [Paenibacillus sp. y28]